MKAQGVGPAAIAKALKIGRASAHRPPALLPPPGPIRRMLSRDLLPMRMRRARGTGKPLQVAADGVSRT
jgi:hypothetical protein